MPGPWPKYAIILTAEQVARLTQLSTSYTAPCAEVQYAQIVLLVHQHPDWRNTAFAREVECCVDTVQGGKKCNNFLLLPHVTIRRSAAR